MATTAADESEPLCGMVVYTNGECIHAGTKKRTGVYSIWIAPGHAANAARWTREGHVTNQTMELAGALAGLEAIDAHSDGAVHNTLYTSSSYVMCCMTRWLPRWERTGWITKQRRAVQNGEVLRRMAAIAHRRAVLFSYVSIFDLIGARTADGAAADADADASSTPASAAAASASTTPLTPEVRDGMTHARQMIVDVTTDNTSTGCSKRRNVLCTWQADGAGG